MAVVVQWLECAVVDNNFSLEKKSSWSQKKLSFLSENVGKFRETRVRFPPSALNLLEINLLKKGFQKTQAWSSDVSVQAWPSKGSQKDETNLFSKKDWTKNVETCNLTIDENINGSFPHCFFN